MIFDKDREMICGLLGEKLKHSYSPEIHEMLGAYSYSFFEKKREELEDFLMRGDFDGLNVTIPYKKEVMPFCKQLSPTALKIGAVNTIVREDDGSLYGYNTDYFGFSDMLKRLGVDAHDGKALILGSGGAAKCVRRVLEDKGFENIINISRRGENNYQNLYRHGDASLIVNATPVGMYPDEGRSLVDLSFFPECKGVLDLIYNPARSALLLQAKALGIPYENGLFMLVSQAKASSELFTQKKIPDLKVQEIYDKLSLSMQNLVLIGMPGSGKTSVGMRLKVLTGREFYDCDDKFNEKYGLSAGDFIRSEGEKKFRVMESELLRELSMKSGCVIATGGGCVTVPENKDVLKANSIVIWLKRDIGKLATFDRPLSESIDLTRMYELRAPLYGAFSDIDIENKFSIEDTAIAIKNKLGL